jgi:hypothetical protein
MSIDLKELTKEFIVKGNNSFEFKDLIMVI